ncbi:MAG: hypothetical protein CVT79_12895 [Alphaproteobacteria bacterium HGW-Alphaproteobacteria-18]|nr:MAG: hypothetical protein CVT79_12895 [Alphaproteobacteria bacterium HGW-Alphaproteobacteria-18]
MLALSLMLVGCQSGSTYLIDYGYGRKGLETGIVAIRDGSDKARLAISIDPETLTDEEAAGLQAAPGGRQYSWVWHRVAYNTGEHVNEPFGIVDGQVCTYCAASSIKEGSGWRWQGKIRRIAFRNDDGTYRIEDYSEERLADVNRIIADVDKRRLDDLFVERSSIPHDQLGPSVEIVQISSLDESKLCGLLAHRGGPLEEGCFATDAIHNVYGLTKKSPGGPPEILNWVTLPIMAVGATIIFTTIILNPDVMRE